MSLKYTSTNRIKFTDISDKYDVSRVVRGKISELHAKLITYVVSHFRNSNQYKQQVVDALNIITYAVYANDPLPFNWSAKSHSIICHKLRKVFCKKLWVMFTLQ